MSIFLEAKQKIHQFFQIRQRKRMIFSVFLSIRNLLKEKELINYLQVSPGVSICFEEIYNAFWNLWRILSFYCILLILLSSRCSYDTFFILKTQLKVGSHHKTCIKFKTMRDVLLGKIAGCSEKLVQKATKQ